MSYLQKKTVSKKSQKAKHGTATADAVADASTGPALNKIQPPKMFIGRRSGTR